MRLGSFPWASSRPRWLRFYLAVHRDELAIVVGVFGFFWWERCRNGRYDFSTDTIDRRPQTRRAWGVWYQYRGGGRPAWRWCGDQMTLLP